LDSDDDRTGQVAPRITPTARACSNASRHASAGVSAAAFDDLLAVPSVPRVSPTAGRLWNGICTLTIWLP
jgi:hypothetical protein